MGINDREKYRDAAWDWDFLDGCWGMTKIRPSDIDGIVERKGHFLLIEAKPPGKEINQGQTILLKEAAKIPTFTVLALHGEPGQPTEMWVVGQESGWKPCNREDVRRFCSEWYAKADSE